MGSDYTLNVTCKILPEYTDFISKEYLSIFNKDFNLHTANQIIDLRRADRTSEELTTLLKEVEDEAAKNISIPDDIELFSDEYRNYQRAYNDKEQAEKTLQYICLPKFYRDLIEIWVKFKLNGFRIFELNDVNTLTCKIQRCCTRHEGDLHEDMYTFVKDIIVPITSEISNCSIMVNDYGIVTNYTDLELRGGRMYLSDLIKSIKHIYDGEDIVETRVIYKRSIKPLQKIDLDRCYGRY